MRRLLLLLPLWPTTAFAQQGAQQVHYAAYAAGLNVMRMDAGLDLQPLRYRMRVNFWTTGTLSVFLRARSETNVEGGFEGGRAAPARVVSTGVLGGVPRVTELDYRDGTPVVRRLTPPIADERDPVPEPLQRGTIDTLSAVAQLIRQVNQTGRCDGAVRIFDGRRLSELRASTVGSEVLPPTPRSTYAGPALRCAFEGRQLAGFPLDADRQRVQRPQQGSAWFASIAPGTPMIPVRIAFSTRWFGDATMFIAARD